MKYQIKVTSCIGTLLQDSISTKDMSKFSVRNELRTRLQLKYGPKINIEIVRL